MLDFLDDLVSFDAVDDWDLETGCEPYLDSDFGDPIPKADDSVLMADDNDVNDAALNAEGEPHNFADQVSFGSLHEPNASSNSFNPYGTFSPSSTAPSSPSFHVSDNSTIFGDVSIHSADAQQGLFGPLSNADAAYHVSKDFTRTWVDGATDSQDLTLRTQWSEMMANNAAQDQNRFDSLTGSHNSDNS